MKTDEWPAPSSPTAPPTVNWYFTRLVGDTPQNDMRATGWLHTWQAGAFLSSLFNVAEQVSCDDSGEGKLAESVIVYEHVLERDADGEPMRSRRFQGRIVGCTYSDAIKAFKKHGDIELPPSAQQWLDQSLGRSSTPKAIVTPPAEAKDAPETPRKQRREKPVGDAPPRAPKDGNLVTVAALAEEHGVIPGKVRDLLRKRNVPKPTGGWTYAKDDPALGAIMDVIKAVKRGEKK